VAVAHGHAHTSRSWAVTPAKQEISRASAGRDRSQAIEGAGFGFPWPDAGSAGFCTAAVSCRCDHEREIALSISRIRDGCLYATEPGRAPPAIENELLTVMAPKGGISSPDPRCEHGEQKRRRAPPARYEHDEEAEVATPDTPSVVASVWRRHRKQDEVLAGHGARSW